MSMLLYGLLTGFLFGLLLQKGRVIRYDKQIGALRFMDMTIVKFMLSAIVAGMVGIYLLRDLGVVKLTFKPTLIWANVLGGLAFGAGWGLLGYCPGTAIGALGEGRWDAIWGILGMLAGAALFAEAYPSLIKRIRRRMHRAFQVVREEGALKRGDRLSAQPAPRTHDRAIRRSLWNPSRPPLPVK
jgi:uncharacterized membrane protein YedE/YeeE